METTVYLDVLFFINFSMDFVTLWLCAVLTSSERRAGRMSLGAAVGALFGILTVIFPTSPGVTAAAAAVAALLMAAVTFGLGGGVSFLIKSTALIWLCAALLGGVMTALLSIGEAAAEPEFHTAGALSAVCAASVVAVYAGVRIMLFSKDRKTATVTARWRENTVTFKALCDSGNLMRDPISGDPVIPVSSEILKRLLGEEATAALISLDSDALYKMGVSLRIIPRKSEEIRGIAGGIIPDSVTIKTGKVERSVRCILSPRDCKADYFAGCAATVPSSLL
ncbi:MAG: sigma-E processing peptidase SpoIIGA [Clostridia bacterium]|nr:sigma-E processing peptidase SpoIIGA [Clostridia bacterium]